jgi:hypothetical protein
MAVKSLRIQRLGIVFGIGALLALAGPAAAQRGFFDSFFGPSFSRPPSYGPSERAPDFSRAPPARKPETSPTSTVLVLGDSMADWLGYGLEDALGDTPEIGVIRKNRAFSGLIRYETRNDSPDWIQVAREAIAADKPNYIVMMIGVHDRQSIRERQATQPGRGAPQAAPASPQTEQQQDHEADQTVAAPELQQSRPRVAGVHEYRSEKWVELYTKRIDDMIAVLKSRGVPVFWVGLPALRGTRSTSDMVYLNELFRGRAEKAGITYVDVWDGFVDESGRFNLRGPDFEGQSRQLRTSDGVHFTKAGARKLAHYLEREIRRASTRGPVPVALPTTEPQPQSPTAKPGGPMARPLAGPVVPLTSTVSGNEELAGAGGSSGSTGHVTATRVLIKGEAVASPAGRADDFAWPKRGVASFGTDPVVATTTLPIPTMQPPPAKTVSAPSTEPAVAAVAPRRAPRPPSPERQRGYSSPFPFFPFFR